MKYLLILFFTGYCLTENIIIINEYNLELKTNEKNFEGTVKLTLSNENNNVPLPIILEHLNITECKYLTENKNSKKESKDQDKDIVYSDSSVEDKLTDCTAVRENNTIIFPEERISKNVTLKFKGTYNETGFSEHKDKHGNRLYVADMTSVRPSKIFPCQEDTKAKLKITSKPENKEENLISNIDFVSDEGGEVYLNKVTFIKGRIKQINKTDQFSIYVTGDENKMSEELLKFLGGVAEYFAVYGKSYKILFTEIHDKLKFNSSGIMAISDEALKNSNSDLTATAYAVTRKLFEKKPTKENEFLDLVLPAFISQQILKSSNFFEYLVSEQIQSRAFETDGFNNSMSLKEKASTFNDNMPQDPILYSKGLSIINSLKSVCGEEKFVEGTKLCIRGNAVAEKAFEKCFDNPQQARDFFETWIDKSGYPVVHVLNKNQEYTLFQERFLWYGKTEGDKWLIPFVYVTDEKFNKKGWVPANSANFTIKTNQTSFALNKDYIGFYRVNYDGKIWNTFISQLKKNFSEIDPFSRAQLIDDVFSFPKSTFSFSQKIPGYVTALQLSEYLKDETEYLPLKAAFNAFDFLDSALDSSLHEKFRIHVKNILTSIYKKSETKLLEDTSHTKKIEVTSRACKFGVEECVKSANEKFSNLTFNGSSLSAEDRIVVCTAVRNDKFRWIETFVKSQNYLIALKDSLQLLACSRDKALLSMYLVQFIHSGGQDLFKTVVSSALENNPDNVNVTLGIIKDLRPLIVEVFSNKYLEEILTLALPKLNSESAETLNNIITEAKLNITQEMKKKIENIQLWSKVKANGFRDYFTGKTGSGSQAKPVALILLATTLLPFANQIFSN